MATARAGSRKQDCCAEIPGREGDRRNALSALRQQKRIKAAFYRADSGAEPARDWLLGVDGEDWRIIGYDIASAEFGWPNGMPTCRPMGQGLYEIHSNLAGNRSSRVFFCVAEGNMVLLHGMIKKSQATPRAALELARKRMKEVSP